MLLDYIFTYLRLKNNDFVNLNMLLFFRLLKLSNYNAGFDKRSTYSILSYEKSNSATLPRNQQNLSKNRKTRF